jgi:hypothetical protein
MYMLLKMYIQTFFQMNCMLTDHSLSILKQFETTITSLRTPFQISNYVTDVVPLCTFVTV